MLARTVEDAQKEIGMLQRQVQTLQAERSALTKVIAEYVPRVVLFAIIARALHTAHTSHSTHTH